MDVQDVLGQARDALTVKRVFGDAIEHDGVIVVPVARVMGGSGFGSGTQPSAAATAGGEAAVGAEGTPTGIGAGFGMIGGPAGAYVIKAGQVSWQPAVNPERMVLISGVVAFLLLHALRGIIKVLAGR